MSITESSREPTFVAQQGDRRLIKRFGDAWTSAAKGRFPKWSELREIDLGRDWNWVFMVDLSQSNGYPHFDFLGSQLAHYADLYLIGGDDWSVSVLDRAADGIKQAVANKAPCTFQDTLTLRDGGGFVFRSLTAPLSDDSVTITHVVGCVSGGRTELSP
ncbi:MAG: hypothetical protein EVA70_03920 [Parvularculaceae bacterium]|nr:MAG: hypothetical protein EVA70_03920 [Parvularculaceae bacterium]